MSIISTKKNFIHELFTSKIKLGIKEFITNFKTDPLMRYSVIFILITIPIILYLRYGLDEEKRKNYSKLRFILLTFAITYIITYSTTVLDWVLIPSIISSILIGFSL